MTPRQEQKGTGSDVTKPEVTSEQKVGSFLVLESSDRHQTWHDLRGAHGEEHRGIKSDVMEPEVTPPYRKLALGDRKIFPLPPNLAQAYSDT